ncbi:MAG TPA: MBL fold metallo-hydrolase [Casimicrobiaceae bacterium]|jgi:glyoxylase-like metal-dependent hydrolase (beta-lactamase superfamily II)|nr:MBL fold metallo-hydrolase [Casimicrobiaceae bacterium]
MSGTGPALPPQVRVFVRDWLSSNNILLNGREGHVLIDSGYGRHAPLTLALLATPQGLGAAPLARLVNTHCHSDHMGGNAAIKAHYDCPIALPDGEAPLIDAWDENTLLLAYVDQRADRFAYDEVIRAGETHVWGDLEWQALAAPGHDMGALVFFNPEHRILVSGDALWANGYGFVMPREIDARALPATRATLEMLAALDVRVVIPGHGEPFADVGAALERAFARTTAFEADSLRVARHALKVVLTFALLDQRRLPLSGMPAYVDRVGIYRDFNARFFRLSPHALAERLVAELEKVHAARREDGWLVPA